MERSAATEVDDAVRSDTVFIGAGWAMG